MTTESGPIAATNPEPAKPARRRLAIRLPRPMLFVTVVVWPSISAAEAATTNYNPREGRARNPSPANTHGID